MRRAVMMSPGTRLSDRYEVDHLIAAGGMAEVYAATDDRLRRPVAIKVVRTADVDVRKRLGRESVILARLDHPNIVRVFDSDEHDGMPFLVMELVDGVSLAEILRTGPLPREQLDQVTRALTDALVHAHDLGITHRGVKPSNVLIDSGGHTRLADFGIARAAGATSVTVDGVALGSVAYVAPEQLDGSPVTPAADIYSTGLVLLECLTGRQGFGGPPAEAAVARLERGPAVPPDLDQRRTRLIESMTCRDPDDRPTAAEIRARLHRLPTSDATFGAETGAAAVIATTGSLDRTVPLQVEAEASAVIEADSHSDRTVPLPPTPDGTAVLPQPDLASGGRGVPSGSPGRRSRRRVLTSIAAFAAASILVVGGWMVASSGDEPPPPTLAVEDEGLVSALDRLERTARDHDDGTLATRLIGRIDEVRRLVFVGEIESADGQVTAFARAVGRQLDAGRIAPEEAERMLAAAATVEYELETLPANL